ncbi:MULTISPECIES: polyamine ABC transporter substrate-binding protein [Methylosinus]|uniref:Putrescine-binding periplasmic protein n=1 Tax=Methylosinus trichosporium (strain ATCC 35070 / NCIMB 11131 / UNIQEM 75 / OB3b) TaxID=595536 RepID=A0A2D2CW07_METT3|nr:MULTISPECIES: polyamine ABC transporter substrate-binding protein [Methylosinus]ATQ66972.1 polyamine ABC transporter substrate-binding protein [Methylosinus trichosporium OB3b]OBS54059.1 spermidine/putrescine ABC transporter substrate-binding protein PotF [Methylosinus sp. 3S-1]
MKSTLALLLLALGAGAANGAERVVNIFNWSDYIDPSVLEDFTRETGVKVVYDTFDSNEVLETRLLAGSAGYDVVVPSATFLQREIKAGVFQTLDKNQLPNLKNVWPEVAMRLSRYDPGNLYAVNYMWFTTGVAYNVAKIKERIGDRPILSWDQVLKPDNLRKFSDCGVYVLDSPEDLFATALNQLKLDPNSKDPSDIRRAADLLSGMRRYVKKFHSSEYINALANGDICLAIGWAGDSFQARNRAREAANGVDINYVIPQEGALMSLDNLAIPKDAPHPREAHLFIDFLLRPDIAARNTMVTNFANGVAASRPLIDKEIAEHPAIYPDLPAMKKLFTVTAPDLPIQKIVTREWTRVKTGR